MIWRTWLVMHEPANEALRALFEEAGVLARVDVTPRPRARLGVVDGRVSFWSDDADRFFRRVRRAERVLALTTATAEQRARMDGVRIQHAGRQFRIHCVPPLSSPYAARLLELRFETVAALPDLSGDTLCVGRSNDVDTDLAPLHVDPVELVLSERVLSNMLGDVLRWEACNALFLPPVRATDHVHAEQGRDDAEVDARIDVGIDYFDPQHLALRDAWTAACGAREPGADQPAAIRMVRAADHPRLRDVLLDGGCLQLCGDDGEPTRVRISLLGRHGAPLVAYRTRLLMQPPRCTAVRSSGTEALLGAVRRDLCDLFDGWAEIGQAAMVTEWRVPPLRSFCSQARIDDGNWPPLARLADRLPAAPRARFWRWVLQPAEARTTCHADSDLVERAFLAHLWRCPWSSDTDGGPWRTAFYELLQHDWADGRCASIDRVARWGRKTGWPRRWASHRQMTSPVVEHRPVDMPADRTTLRLLLPLGTILRTAGMASFDDATCGFGRGVWGT